MTTPRFSTSWVRDDGNVNPLEPIAANANMRTQYVNVEALVKDNAFNVPSASQPMRGFATQDTMM